jgi:hypothetical protein
VIERAKLTVALQEITNLSQILAEKIDTVPTLKIQDKAFTFNEKASVNLRLKDAIKYLLQIHNYGDWSCIAIPLLQNTAISKPVLYAHQLAERQNACLELQFVTEDETGAEWEIDSMIRKIGAINQEPMDLILSRPIVSHARYKNSVHAHIINYIQQNQKRLLVVSSSIWKNCTDEMRQIQPHLSAPLLSISENCNYRSKIQANWYIDLDGLGSKTLRSISDLFQLYEIEITVIASSAEKTRVSTALQKLKKLNSITFQWIQRSKDLKAIKETRDKMIILNSSKVPEALYGTYSSLSELVNYGGIVSFLPEKCRTTGKAFIPKWQRRVQSLEQEATP